ncbi:hypothetical protein BFP97_10565 [Roseivirga sp. 4D4]|uniref:DUF6090 family protein n=1 Tax=Roseivirga sp. 4D4 TaxID=1889784 RepID=UPI000852A669|nr:DUF6090 family protein [Roseivirga sp. 4D4]OEK01931.1 hypothetical protein BFP97_10565 [Roseivirga sp. 4D4]
MKSTKYLKYAVGEIFLVVIGILIALSINNWNTKNQFSKWEKQYLIDLENELSANLEQLQEVDSIQSLVGESLERTIAVLENDPENINELNLNYQIVQSQNPTFFPTSGVYETSLASGKIEEIKNNKLKYEIMNLYNRYFERTMYNGEVLDGVVEKIDWDILIYWDSRTQKFKPLKKAYGSELIKLMNYHLEQNQVYTQIVKTNITKLIELKSSVDQELNNT